MPTLTCVRWYERIGPETRPVERWLRAAERFPAAVPVRFGSTEPLTHRFDQEGQEGLRIAEREAGGLLFMTLQNPRSQASLATAGTTLRLGDHGAHTMVVDLSPDEPRLQEFALAVASEHTVFVSISLQRRRDAGDRGVREPYLAPQGRWLGLPPERPVWSWFGADYCKTLTKRHVVLDHDDRGGTLPGPEWVPEEFRARPDEAELRLRVAPRIPRALR